MWVRWILRPGDQRLAVIGVAKLDAITFAQAAFNQFDGRCARSGSRRFDRDNRSYVERDKNRPLGESLIEPENVSHVIFRKSEGDGISVLRAVRTG